MPLQAVLATLRTEFGEQVTQVVAVSYTRQLVIVAATTVQTPLLFGKNPVAQTKQVNGATLVALIQLANETDTQELTPFEVWMPKLIAQEAHALIELYVKQLEAPGTTQDDELAMKNPDEQALQVKLAE